LPTRRYNSRVMQKVPQIYESSAVMAGRNTFPPSPYTAPP
jgi:hypothetical protein